MVLHTYATLSCGPQKNHSLFLVVLRRTTPTTPTGGVNPPIHFLAQISLESLRRTSQIRDVPSSVGVSLVRTPTRGLHIHRSSSEPSVRLPTLISTRSFILYSIS